MKLSAALQVSTGDIVAFVGAGGKTSALFRLANELAADGLRVVSTTTTRLSAAEIKRAPYQLALGNELRIPDRFPALLEEHRHLFIYRSIDSTDNKAEGLPPAWLDEKLSPHPAIDVLLIEADGARRLPLKGPYAHEPVIPPSATLIVPVAALTALDLPLDRAHIYGAENIADVLALPLGTPITPVIVAAALAHPRLGGKLIPSTARVIPLLNRVTADSLPAARDIAHRLLTTPHIERVLLGEVQSEPPIREVHRHVAGIVLAAGLSTRMGQPKVLKDWGGEPMIRRICRTLFDTPLAELLVVTGKWQDEIRTALSALSLRFVHNPLYEEEEMLTSLQAGLRTLDDHLSAALVILADQPDIAASTVTQILNAYAQNNGTIIAPTYDGQRGHPVLFDRAHWQDLLALPPDKAPRHLLQAQPEALHTVSVSTDTILQDIDTPDDYQQHHPDQ